MESSSDLPVAPDVENQNSAAAFVRWCVSHIGLGYHPSTAFEDYVDSNSRPLFTSEIARMLNEQNARAFTYCDPYDIGLIEIRRKLKEEGLL